MEEVDREHASGPCAQELPPAGVSVTDQRRWDQPRWSNDVDSPRTAGGGRSDRVSRFLALRTVTGIDEESMEVKKPPEAGGSHTPTSSVSPGNQSRILPLLAAERVLRAVLLIGIGLVLLTHPHTDWAAAAQHGASLAGLDPSGNESGRLISGLAGFGPEQAWRYGAIAVAYGLLEAADDGAQVKLPRPAH